MAEAQPNEDTERAYADFKLNTASRILERLNWGRLFWKPLHDRMDYGLTMYLLLDPIQQAKPTGYRRFVSNDPRTAVDAAVSILTRNDPFWRIDMPYGMGQDERERVGMIERGLDGIVDDLDAMFTERGEPLFWKQAAFFALMRGAVAGKFQITKQALDYGRPTPLLGEFWDERMVYPSFDGIGLYDVVVEKHTTLAELMAQYPERLSGIAGLRDEQTRNMLDPNARCIKIEYWSNNRPNMPGTYGVLGQYSTQSITGEIDPVKMDAGTALWLVEPVYHGYTPEQLPVIVTPVNGIPIKMKPLLGQQVLSGMQLRAQARGLAFPSWHDPSGWVAEWGRGLLTSVEEHIPQYNELMATVLQHFSMGAFGTWVFKTQTGELPDFIDGLNAKVPLRIGEDVQRFEPRPVDTDAWRMLEVLQNERQRGMLNALLMGMSASAESGAALQQRINASLNSLEPFQSGLATFGSSFGSHILEQLKVAGIDTLSLVSRGNSRTYFRVEFDPKTHLGERKYKPVPIFRPAVPEDILFKAQAARLLLDPRAPVMSVISVLDRLFQLDDPEGETKRMLEDVANRDPVLLLERIASVLEEEGEPEMAQRIRQKEFQARFQEEAAQLQLQAQVEMIRGQLGANAGGGPGAAGGAAAPTGPVGGAPSATGAGQPGGQGGVSGGGGGGGAGGAGLVGM